MTYSNLEWALAISLLISLIVNVIQSHAVSLYKNSYLNYRHMYEEILRRNIK